MVISCTIEEQLSCLDDLSAMYPDIPIVGIIEPAADKVVRSCSEDSQVGIIGTKVTISTHAEGEIRNSAGVLSLIGKVKSEMVCICDRCAAQFRCEKVLPLELKLAADLTDEDSPDIFSLDGDWLDLSDVLETSYILSTDTKFLCREDCAGLCPKCGKNLNDGPCGCKKEIDPRLAVLGQLLDIKDE